MFRHRRALFVGVLAAAVGFVVLDPIGLVDGLWAWLTVGSPAEGSPAEVASTIRARRARIQRLAAILDRDPLLSGGILTAGVGAGVVLGGVGGYLHQRRSIRRGDGDG